MKAACRVDLYVFSLCVLEGSLAHTPRARSHALCDGQSSLARKNQSRGRPPNAVAEERRAGQTQAVASSRNAHSRRRAPRHAAFAARSVVLKEGRTRDTASPPGPRSAAARRPASMASRASPAPGDGSPGQQGSCNAYCAKTPSSRAGERRAALQHTRLELLWGRRGSAPPPAVGLTAPAGAPPAAPAAARAVKGHGSGCVSAHAAAAPLGGRARPPPPAANRAAIAAAGTAPHRARHSPQSATAAPTSPARPPPSPLGTMRALRRARSRRS
jgi:hypothetical protein